MTRETKFRAWCSGKMGNITFSETHMEYNVMIGKNGGYLDVESGWDIHGEIMEIPVMQFTGLKDKNKKEIYERDIVRLEGIRIEGKNKEVSFKNGAFGIDGYSFDYGFEELNWEEIEIIGNRFENPELLK